MAQKQGTHTEVPAKGGFPPFQKETFATQLFWLALCFIVLYLLVARIALPRIASIIEERRRRVAGDLAEASRLKEQADEAVAAYDKALADARARAQAAAGETRDRLNAEADKRRKVLEDELNAKLAAAEQQIAATQSAAMANVRGIAIEAAGAIVARLIGVTPPARGGRRRGRRRAQALKEPAMSLEAEFWVAVAFVLFLAVLAKYSVHHKVLGALDGRSARIKSELDEARRLRDEAQAILAESQRKRRDAEQEAEAIMAGAKAEAERLAAEAKVKMEEFIARRTKMAETKIAQAEVAGAGRRARRRGRSRRQRRGKNSDTSRQGKNRRRPHRPRHRGCEEEA